MLRLFRAMGHVIGVKELAKLSVFFVLAAFCQGVTLGLMVPFLQAFLAGEPVKNLVIAIAVSGIVTVVLQAGTSIRSYRVSVYSVCDSLMKRIGRRVFKLPLGWFDANRSAKVSVALSKHVHTVSHVASMLLPNIINAFVPAAVMVVVVASVDWRLGLIMLLVVPFLVIGWASMRKAITAAKEIENEAAGKTAGRIVEFAGLQPVLRATGVAQSGWRELDEAVAAEGEATLESLRTSGKPAQIFSGVVSIVFALLLTVGLMLGLKGDIDMVAFIAIAVVTVRIVGPLSQSILYGAEVHASEVALEAIDEIVDAQMLPEPGNPVTELGEPEIVFDKVSFGYDENPVINEINLRVPAGAMTAIVGPSGVGKSTLLRLVARFWDVDEGSVQIGGVDVRSFDSDFLMSKIAMVFQDVYLFDTTIAENIRLAKPDATDQELMAAAKAAKLDSVIAELPDGWDTQVGQGGLKLSGGQRQRVSIARAFIKDAPILLLDEITSALDGENEAAITDVMAELTRGRTVIVVAHRLSTIMRADQVVVLQAAADGFGATVAQVGSPQKLLSKRGIFADFVEISQVKGRWQLKN